jgi:hypothetical protein
MAETYKQETKAWQIPNGYEGTNIPTDFSIPSCGLEDVDRALFNFFDKKVGFTIEAEGHAAKVPVIFAGGERFAMIKKGSPIRDKNGALILPLISIRRTGIAQTGDDRGALRNTGDLVVKKLLSSTDRNYQRLLNKDGIENQDNVATRGNFADTDSTPPRAGVVGRLASRRAEGRSQITTHGPSMASGIGKNIFEIITIPFPQYFTAKYEIIFWSQYAQHMNQMLEQLMVQYDDTGTVQANVIRLDTDKGYWFVGTFENEITPDDNSTDYTEDDRLIKSTLTIEVKGYIVAPAQPGMQSPFRKYLSAPSIKFESRAVSTQIKNDFKDPVMTSDTSKFILQDVTVQDIKGEPQKRRGSLDVELLVFDIDPFSGKKSTKYVSTPSRGQRTGETVYKRAYIEDLGDDVI